MAADAPGTVSQVTAQALPRLRAPKRARLWQPQRLTRRRSLQAAMARRVLSCSPRSVFPKTPRGLQFCLVANYLITSGSCIKQCSSIRYRGTTDRLDSTPAVWLRAYQFKVILIQEGSKPDCRTSLDLGTEASLTQRFFLLLWRFKGGSLKINTLPGLPYPMMRNP